MESKDRGMTVLMLPWLGHSHVSSYLQLGKRLARRGVSVYLCSTPVNLTSVKKTLVNNPSIKTIELHLTNFQELPPHHHTVNGLPPNLLPTLKKGFDMAAPEFSDILKTVKPDLLISDIFQYWAPEVALSHNVPSVIYITSGAVTCCYFFHQYINPHSPFPFPEIYVTDYEKSKHENAVQVNAHGMTTLERVLSCFRQSQVVLVKSCNEIEEKYINYLSTLCEKTVLPAGLIVSESVDWKDEEDHTEIFEWLNKKDKASTVFVSTGTECHLSNDDIEDIASGLELSCVNFIWFVKFPDGDFMGEFLKKFRQRIGEKGMILETWAPQARILTHSSIGGFVSHCGRGSVTEALAYGVPIIAIPMQYDQPLNARVVHEAGLGEEVKRDEDGRLQGDNIANVIKKIVSDKDGDEIRRKTQNLSKSQKESGDKYLDIVVEELHKLCNI
ncbi:UDP-glucosyltransferase 29-like [Apium graveolens]|uniref:UDP-glucosyltransferase 29-like n=1 Tax=Apium graveolens TaxID=4045 RepID=UPI003D7B057B